MTYENVYAYLKERGEAVIGVASVASGWVQDVNTVDNGVTMPCVLITPPEDSEDLKGVVTYQMVMYVIGTALTDSGQGVEMTDAQKITQWDTLKGYAREMIRDVVDKDNQLAAFSRTALRITNFNTKRNEMASDKVDLFLQVTFKLETTIPVC